MVICDIAQSLMRKRCLVPSGIQFAVCSLFAEFVMYIVVYLLSGAELISAYLVASGAIVLRIVFCLVPFCILRYVFPAQQATRTKGILISLLWCAVTTTANVMLSMKIGLFYHSLIFFGSWIVNGYKIITEDRRRYLFSAAYDAPLYKLESIQSQGEAIIQYVESGAAYASFASGEMPQNQFETTMKAYNIAISESHNLEGEIESLRKQLQWEIKR